MATERGRFPWVLTVVCGTALALLIGLGAWQVRRLAWKESLIAQAAAAAAAPPAPLGEVLDGGDDPEFRRVIATCSRLSGAPSVELQSIQDGEAGVRLVSLCRFDATTPPILIDRGFVAETVSARPGPLPDDSRRNVPVLAQLRRVPPPGPLAPAPQGGRFFARDVPAMGRALGAAEVQPMVLFALASTDPDWKALRPSAPPAAFSNNHLGYALTWFGLAIALTGFYVALLRRRLRKSAS
ncbi:MAG TPA: SURF1 family protein [Brevundimonas sp.]|jgi:surfeit locus 1 family protein|uniref:SURF1 family protein n=1 Tax=Brevundimonas sp. TaxID=1871086 RepID=UPI002DF67EAD|nr:SURF1 family protein [Brevundimonas sp.]